LAKVIAKLEAIQKEAGGKVSLADLIVLGGNAAIEKAAKDGGVDVKVPFTPGRADATQEETEVHSFEYLNPKADGFRNYVRKPIMPIEDHLVDRAQLLELTAPELTVLIGGLRVLQVGDDKHGVLTTRSRRTLSNDFFVNLLDMGVKWKGVGGSKKVRRPRPQDQRREVDRHARRPHLRLALAVLRALAEVYGAADAKEKFVKDFVAKRGRR
jgi:catalase-peroxidase